MLHLGFDQLAQRSLIPILELLRCKLRRLTFDQLLRKRKLVLVNSDLLDVSKILGRITQLLRISHGIGHHPRKLVVSRRTEANQMFPSSKSNLAQTDLLG